MFNLKVAKNSMTNIIINSIIFIIKLSLLLIYEYVCDYLVVFRGLLLLRYSAIAGSTCFLEHLTLCSKHSNLEFTGISNSGF